jgi:hypothetical protein
MTEFPSGQFVSCHKAVTAPVDLGAASPKLAA